MFLEYGIDVNGELVHISTAQRGKTALVCPYCGGSLIARKGRVKVAHFAHAGETCRPTDRAGDVVALPCFDRFDLHLKPKIFDALKRFHDIHYYNGRERDQLTRFGLLQEDWKGRDELSKLGRIPFGELPLASFSTEQDKLIINRHAELVNQANALYLSDQDHEISLTDLHLYRAQWRRVLSASLYFLEVTHDAGTLYKIGVTHRGIDQRIAEIQADLLPHVGTTRIKVLRLLIHRGSIELYFKFRYAVHQYPIGQFTEYFQVDDATRRNAKSDLTRLKDKELSDLEQAILDGIEPAAADHRIDPHWAETKRLEAEKRAAWEQTLKEPIRRSFTRPAPALEPNPPVSQVPITDPEKGDSKRLDVSDPRRKAYSRVIKTRPVTFTCAECGQTVTEDLFPGGAPKWCNGCIREVRKRQNADRVRKFREQQKQRAAHSFEQAATLDQAIMRTTRVTNGS